MQVKKAVISAAGAIVALGAIGRWANGAIYSSLEARELIEALSGSALYLGSAIAGSAATTLALMLTLLGLVRRLNEDFDKDMYRRIDQIAVLSTGLLGGSVVMLLMMTLPIGEFENVPVTWFAILYEVLFWLVVALSAALLALVMLLYTAIRTLIANITPGDEV
ncbi:MAG: hypothetical protein V2J14_06745 [Erythrobacter sp.]|jgi:hypothetical protein|nr:hypothetical protein [Erythrobacter sp.]